MDDSDLESVLSENLSQTQTQSQSEASNLGDGGENTAHARTIEEWMEYVKGNERFQLKAFLIFCWIWVSTGAQILGMAFSLPCPESQSEENPFYNIGNSFNVCESTKYASEYVSMSFFLGWFLGAGFFGWVSDTFGRLITVRYTYLAQVVSVLAIVFSPWFAMVVVGWGVFGCVTGGFSEIAYVLGVEYFTHRKTLVGNLYNTCFAIGGIFAALLARLILSWRPFTFCTGLMSVAVVPFASDLVESPRWLVSKGTLEKRVLAMAILVDIGVSNGMKREDLENFARKHPLEKMPDTGTVNLNLWTALQKGMRTLDIEPSKLGKSENVAKKSPLLLFALLIMMFTWFAVSIGYYGTSIEISSLSGDPYANVAIMGVAEIPSYLLVAYTMTKWGHKRTFSVALIAAAIAFCGVALVTLEWRRWFAFVGKFFVSCAFGAAYVFAMRIFPVAVRSSCLGLCSQSSRFGGILMPLFGASSPWVYALVCGTASVAIAAL